MKKLLSIQAWAAMILMFVGVTTMIGWIARNAAVVQLDPDLIGMVFSAAFCFVLIGFALLLPIFGAPSASRMQTSVGKILIAIAAMVLLDYATGIHTPLNLHALHAWLESGNPVPGRMAPSAAIGFALAGLVLVMMRNVGSKAAGGLLQIATFLLLVLGFIGIATYSLHLDLLYPWVPAKRVAIQTAACMLVAGVGLWDQWRRADWYRSQRYFSDDEKTGYVAATILTFIAMTAGIVGFSVQQATLGKTLSENLVAHLRNQTTLFQTGLNESIADAETLTARPSVIQLTRALTRNPGDAESARQLRDVGDSILASRYSGIAFYDANGRELLRLGRFSQTPQIKAELGLAYPAALLWDNGVLINSRLPLRDKQQVVGAIVVEQPLPLIAEQLAQTEGFGKTGELGFCTRQEELLTCFPQRRNPTVHRFARLNPDGKPTPMAYATDGHTGIMNGIDYRQRNVIAAYGPLTSTGLGIVVKQDTEELYQPIREQLNWYIPLLLLLVVGGGVLLRSQVKPLVAKLLRSEQDATTRELHIRTVVDNIAEGIITLNESGVIESFNRAASRIFGYLPEEAVGMPITQMMPPAMRSLHDAGIQRYLRDGQPRFVGMGNRELPALHKNGTIFPLELAITEMRVADHHLFVGIVRDITERKRAERALQESEARSREITETLGEGVFVTDRDGMIIFSNPAAQKLLGWTEQELLGQHGHTLFHHTRADGSPYPEAECEIGNFVRTGQCFRAHDEAFWRKDGSMLPVSINSTPIIRGGKIVGAVVAFHDIIERKKAAEQVEHLAHFDLLTDLPNRALLADRLKQALAKARRDKYRLALMFIDLDRFKPVNDTFGHDVGDLLLKEVAHRLRGCLRESDTVARVGGDEFIVLLPQIEAEQYGVLVAEKILAALNEPFLIDGHVLDISASIGVAVYPEDGDQQEALMKSADSAMYRAKEQRGTVVASGRSRHDEERPALSD